MCLPDHGMPLLQALALVKWHQETLRQELQACTRWLLHEWLQHAVQILSCGNHLV